MTAFFFFFFAVVVVVVVYIFLLVLLECNQDSTCCNEDFRVFPQVLQSFCDLVHFLSAAVSSSLPSGAFRQRGEETAQKKRRRGGEKFTSSHGGTKQNHLFIPQTLLFCKKKTDCLKTTQ